MATQTKTPEAATTLDGALERPIEYIRCPQDEAGRVKLFGALSPSIPMGTWFSRSRVVLNDGRIVSALTEVRTANVPEEVLSAAGHEPDRLIFPSPAQAA